MHKVSHERSCKRIHRNSRMLLPTKLAKIPRELFVALLRVGREAALNALGFTGVFFVLVVYVYLLRFEFVTSAPRADHSLRCSGVVLRIRPRAPFFPASVAFNLQLKLPLP